MANPVASSDCFLCIEEMCVYVATDAAFTTAVFKLPRIQSVDISVTEDRPEKRADSDTAGLRVSPCNGTVETECVITGSACLVNWIEEYVVRGDVKWLRMYPDCNDNTVYRDLKVRFGAFDYDAFDNNSAEPIGWTNTCDVTTDSGWTGITTPTNQVTALPA